MKTYSSRLLLVISFVLISISAFNYVIDPYGVIGSSTIEGINKYKPEIERYSRLGKPYQVKRLNPESVLLASSRGLEVTGEMIGGKGIAYNASLPSGSTYEQYRMMQHVLAVSDASEFILALDESFTASVQPNFNESRFYTGDGNTKMITRVKDMFFSLLSLNALKSSMRTLRKQSSSPQLQAADYQPDRVARAGGHRRMFREMEFSIFNNALRLYTSSECHDVDADNLENLEIFEQLIDLSYRSEAEMKIYFSPVHARFYEAKCITGQWKNMENMKRTVIEIVTRLADEYDRPPYSVWDFSGYNVVTTEAVPPQDDINSMMQWYWEGSHYTLQHAGLIFDVLNGYSSDYGVQLTSDNIEQHLAEISKDREKYMTANPQDIDELNELAKQVIERR